MAHFPLPSPADSAAPVLPGGPRRLLARLRALMAKAHGGQQVLDGIVALIAEELGSEVCSLYLLTADHHLELSATMGLRPEAVHRTRLRLAEGIIGEIAARAQPLALSNAQAHPSFAYRPETGEEALTSMAGVPILRGGQVRGVLAVQNRQRRNYRDEEMESLATIAMLIAEVATEAAPDPTPAPGQRQTPGLRRLAGRSLHRGLALGVIRLHEPQMTLHQMMSEDSALEYQRLDHALTAMRGALDRQIHGDHFSGESREILETFRLMADDPGWARRIREAIGSGLSAEAAVKRVLDDTRLRMRRAQGGFARDRLLDIQDLTHRLLLQLARLDHAEGPAPQALQSRAVLVAETMGPTELLDYPRGHVCGLILGDAGGASSHVAIVARALDIPILAEVPDAMLLCRDGEPVILDTEAGEALLDPGEDLLEAYGLKLARRTERRRSLQAKATRPAVSRDGIGFSVQVNAGIRLEVEAMADGAADGIGLFRTEIPFMIQDEYPGVDRQEAIYAAILEAARGAPVHFRTLDVGGDKLLSSFNHKVEQNPALGWRALRIGLDRPGMLREQLRAMIRAHGARPMSVMFPLVATVAELDQARGLLRRELARAEAEGRPIPGPVRVGVMLEVPSLLWQLPALLQRVDFVSVGSNDLSQYLFAADRQNAEVFGRYDPLSAPFLSALSMVAWACNSAGVPVSLCGEMAGQPLEALALAGIGYRRLSMSPHALAMIKQVLSALDVAAVSDAVRQFMGYPGPSIRPLLAAWARDHHLPLTESESEAAG